VIYYLVLICVNYIDHYESWNLAHLIVSFSELHCLYIFINVTILFYHHYLILWHKKLVLISVKYI